VNEKLLPREDLTAAQEDAMFDLFRRHFTGVSRKRFHDDLDRKGWVILLEEDGALGGFSSLDLYDTLHRGERVSVVYSGDTIVDDSARSSAALSYAWIGAVNHLRRELGKERLWWLLLVSGFRTYRFLPTFWRRFHPCHSEPWPPGTRDLMEHLATERFGPSFDREAGIVRFDPPQVLRAEARGIPSHRARDPHVAYFADRNPGHERGDELVCLTDLSRDNLTRAGERMWALGDRWFAARGAVT
jgi:hypothetical protein